MALVERDLTILNAHGLHVRPASKFAEVADRFACDITVTKEGNQVNGKAIIELLTLAATSGAVLRLRCEGHDAQQAADALTELVRTKFGID